MVKAEPDISRRQLSRRICTLNHWYSANGKPKEANCRKALLELDRRGVINLPPALQVNNFKNRQPLRLLKDQPLTEATLSELGRITLEPVRSRYSKAAKTYRELLEKYHYLGPGRLCGAQVRYIVESETYGVIGALAFSSGTWALKARDQYIGWDEHARRANLGKVVLNARFLLLPHLKVANLASHVLALALSRLPQDWQERYKTKPVLVETFVDPRRHTGVSYRAANFSLVGHTSGRRGEAKAIYLYPLGADWQEVLCRAPVAELGERTPVEDPAHWAEAEFSTVRLCDPRLKRRLYAIALDFFDNCAKNVPEACGSRAKTIAAYRFFQNKEVGMDVILDAHTEATTERLKKQRVVLAPQDTTILDYSTHPMTEGLGPINGAEDHALGLILHDTVAFSEDGTPLGVLDAQCWARDPEDRGKSRRRKQLPLEQKESAKWLRSLNKVAAIQKLCPETTLVSIGDREADIYELFKAATALSGPQLLVRVGKGRNRRVEQKQLFSHMASFEEAGTLKLNIPRSGSSKAREATVEIRFAPVSLEPPKQESGSEPLKLWAVYLTETKTPDGITPVEWMLLTTVPAESFKAAQKIVEWYSVRWGIEVYHRTLKSGCRIKTRQLGKAENLETCLGIDMVVAWRIFHLTMLGRETPDLPCTVFFDENEWKALCVYVSKNPDPPDKPPTLKEAIFMVAGIGGFMGRKGDGFPGTETMWRGLQRLETAAEMYWIVNKPGIPPPKSEYP